MSIEITSTTDSEEQVTAAVGGKVEEPVKDEKKSAPVEDEPKQDETPIGDEDSETSEDSDVEESEAQDNEDEGEKERPKKFGKLEKRFKKLTKKLSAKDQEIEYWRKAALAREGGEKPQAQIEASNKPDASKKPSPDDFEDHDEYLEALVDWKAEQKIRFAEEKRNQERLKSEVQDKQELLNRKIEEFSSQHEDFFDRLETVDDIPMSLTVQEVIFQSEDGPALMYELAKDRDNYKRICNLPAILAARELGKIELRITERLESKSKKQKPKTTNAPDPITPIKGKSVSGGAKTIFDDDISQAEFERLRSGA